MGLSSNTPLGNLGVLTAAQALLSNSIPLSFRLLDEMGGLNVGEDDVMRDALHPPVQSPICMSPIIISFLTRSDRKFHKQDGQRKDLSEGTRGGKVSCNVV